jgi:hypothetical protein
MQVVVPLLIFGFLLYCVLDVVLTSQERVRNLPKLAWLLLVLLVPIVGGVVWLVAGRPSSNGRAPGGGGSAPRLGPGAHPAGRPCRVPGGTGSGPPPSSRAPRGPDDDPEFIRQLERRIRRPGDEPPAA